MFIKDRMANWIKLGLTLSRSGVHRIQRSRPKYDPCNELNVLQTKKRILFSKRIICSTVLAL